MGSASSTYRPKCIYLDIDGRIQKVLLLFFTKWRLRAVFAARPIPDAHPAGSASLFQGKGGGSCVPSALYTDVYLKGKGRLAQGRAGRCQHPSLPALPAGVGILGFAAAFWLPLPEQPRLQSLARGEVSPPIPGSGSRG